MSGKMSKSLCISVVAVLAFTVMLLAGCQTLPDVAKFDLHIAVDIREDGSNQVDFQVATNPLLDKPLAAAVMEWCAAAGAPATGSATSGDTTAFECRETKRDGRQYHTLTARFASLGDLNAFMNSPHQVSGLLSIVMPDAQVPRLFDEFEARRVTEEQQPGFRVHARLSDDLEPLLNFCRITIHTKLPYSLDRAATTGEVHGDEASWRVQAGGGAGQALDAAAAEPLRLALVREIEQVKTERPVLFWLPIGLVGLAVVAAVGTFSVRRAVRRREESPSEVF